MIYGELKKLDRYKGISKHLDVAIEYILTGNYKGAELGKNIVDGENLFFNQPDYQMTKEISEGIIENHRKYIDIHIVIEGEERIGVISNTDLKLTKEYDEIGDYELYEVELENIFYLNPQKFIIIFPGEPHMAMIKGTDKKTEIKKVIFKILAD